MATGTYTSFQNRLLNDGWLNEEELQAALFHQNELLKKGKKVPLGEALVYLGLLESHTLQHVLSDHTGYPNIDIRSYNLAPHLIDLIPMALCQKHRCFVFDHTDNVFHMAMADPEELIVRDFLSNHYLKGEIKAYHCDPIEIEKVLKRYNAKPISFMSDNQAVDLVDAFLIEAYYRDASDIHLRPKKQTVEVFYRIDGILEKTHIFHKNLWPQTINRLKVMASLDIAESRIPQSGQIPWMEDIPLRISTHPSNHGEITAIRYLRPVLEKSLDHLGFPHAIVESLREAIQKPYGLVVISGSTGAGKTTTLHALLQELDHEGLNIMALEDPIEIENNGVSQTDMRFLEKSGFNYAAGIKSLLRQDPDVLLIGEIRDSETASMCVRAALTGHLVLTTIHASHASLIPHRFIDFGISPHLLSEVLLAGMHQKLKPIPCIHCAEQGCESCNNKGYKGRNAWGELILFEKDWLRGLDLNQRPSGYEPDELPGCSTPRQQLMSMYPINENMSSK
jgi:type II secretory ATPase GspE/PulE/Tfp pilus assembly ATPase PilB-like protein